MKIIDDFLNGITMYRLVLYYLICLLVIAGFLSFFNLLPFNFLSLMTSAGILTAVSWATNTIFSKVFKVPTNVESAYITALILSLIITPIRSSHDLPFLFWAAVLSISSKFILAVNKKHFFNPAALAVVITAITLNNSASWWVGSSWMVIFVTIGGLLVIRKIRRFSLVISFLTASLLVILGSSLLKGDYLSILQKALVDTPILFFAFIMLTEPQTTPPTRNLQIIYGGLTGLFFAPSFHIGSLYFTPEIALLVGNIYSYIVSPKEKFLLKLKEKIPTAPDIYDFVFGLNQKFSFVPGQYMEWTLAQKNPDSRGSRRYFTVSSSPTEANLRIGVKFYPNSSSWKKTLLNMQAGGEIIAGQLSGEFNLPKDPGKKLVFIAGGIGITPFRSMIKYLLDTNQKRDIVLFYSNKTAIDAAYKNIFDKAKDQLGIKTIYVATDTQGFINSEMIGREVPDFKDRIFYISGPHSMVDVFEKTLKDMGIPGKQIKTDFFPGYV